MFSVSNYPVMKKIIIALDYNPSAEKVAMMGYELAKALSAEVTLVHVVRDIVYYGSKYSPIMGYTGTFNTGPIPILSDFKKEAAAYLSSSAKHLKGANIKTKVLSGSVREALLDFGNSHKADLIVMGSHSHAGLGRLLVSDNAVNVLKHSKIPLFIIPIEDE